MILAFEFNYISKNGVLDSLLQEIVTDFGITAKIVHQETMVTLYVEEEENRLDTFADALSLALPLSIFFKSSSVYVAETMPSHDEGVSRCAYDIVFRPKVLMQIDGDKAPFFTKKSKPNIALIENQQTTMEAHTSEEYVKLYEIIAQKLLQQEAVCVEHNAQSYWLTAIEKADILENYEVIATDFSTLERLAVIRENEMKALASLERPSLCVKVNALFAQKNIFSASRVVLRLADDLFLYQLSKVLFEKGVFFIARSPKVVSTLTKVVLNDEMPVRMPIQISVFENGEIAIVKGDAYASLELKANVNKFEEPSHAIFASIMQECQLFEYPSSCFYFSTAHNDRIMHYSKEHGMLNLIAFTIPESFEALIADIKRSHPSAERLVENYQAQFPEIYEHALKTTIAVTLPQSVFSLWSIAAVLLGICSSLEEGGKRVIENAEDFGGQKGPRMDYYSQKPEALSSDFDYVRLMKSAMSYKLAGTDDNTLSFGLMESLAYFLTDLADAHKESLSNERIALGGSLFAHKRFSEIVIKNIKPNHTICMNKELPIDL